MSESHSTADTRDLAERVALIESMLAQGRRTTAHWSWAFILWGIAYLAALVWSMWGPHAAWAWPVCVGAAMVLTIAVIVGKRNDSPETTIGLAIGSIWLALGISMVVVFVALSISGRLTDVHTFVAIVCAFLGMANGASALVLRWKAQFACAVAWWIATIAGCFGSAAQSIAVFASAIVLCQVAFGIYAMAHEARHSRSGAVHA